MDSPTPPLWKDYQKRFITTVTYYQSTDTVEFQFTRTGSREPVQSLLFEFKDFPCGISFDLHPQDGITRLSIHPVCVFYRNLKKMVQIRKKEKHHFDESDLHWFDGKNIEDLEYAGAVPTDGHLFILHMSRTNQAIGLEIIKAREVLDAIRRSVKLIRFHQMSSCFEIDLE
ncbi:MAG: hypothetical protein KBA26_03080 [Candidatus Delongbacteria bacterium]|nr:hypothetical protein [Candidatus Delongbacteria bacterium]